MTLRPPRTVLAFVVTLVCALAVFTLPRFAWNTIHAAGRQTPAGPETTAQGTSSIPRPAAAAPRTLGPRLTGLLGVAFIMGLGVAVSRNRRGNSRRVVVVEVRAQLVLAVFVL